MSWEGVEELPPGVNASTMLHGVFLNQQWLEQYHSSQARRDVRVTIDRAALYVVVTFVTTSSSSLVGTVHVEERMRCSTPSPDQLCVTCDATLTGAAIVTKLHPTYVWQVTNDKILMKLQIVFVSLRFFFCFVCFAGDCLCRSRRVTRIDSSHRPLHRRRYQRVKSKCSTGGERPRKRCWLLRRPRRCTW